MFIFVFYKDWSQGMESDGTHIIFYFLINLIKAAILIFSWSLFSYNMEIFISL